MGRNHVRSDILNAQEERHGERYVRKSGRMQGRRETVRSAWREISRIAKRGLD